MLRALAVLAAALVVAAADQASVVWNYSSSPKSECYWNVGTFAPTAIAPDAPPVVLAGTFGLTAQAHVDSLSITDGHVVHTQYGELYKPCNDWGRAHQATGAVGYDPDAQAMPVFYAPDPALPPIRATIPGGFYFAEGDATCVVRDDAMLVFGQYSEEAVVAARADAPAGFNSPVSPHRRLRRRLRAHASRRSALAPAARSSSSSSPPSSPANSTTPVAYSACMFIVRASGGGALTPGPCLYAVGDGEAADTLAASVDGNVVLLVAGFQLLVVERTAPDWSAWRTRLALNSSARVGTYEVGALSADATYLAYQMQGEAHVLKWDGAQYNLYTVIPQLVGMFVQDVTFSQQAQPLLAVNFYDFGALPRYGVAAFDISQCNGTAVPLWSFVTPHSTGQETEAITSVAVSDAGEVVAITAWGDETRITPQLHVFRGWHGTGAPLLALHTPGSMSQATAVAVGANAALVAAVGIRTHENEGVLGGFAVLVKVTLD